MVVEGGVGGMGWEVMVPRLALQQKWLFHRYLEGKIGRFLMMDCPMILTCGCLGWGLWKIQRGFNSLAHRNRLDHSH